MATLELTDHTLHVTIEGIDKVLALRSSIRVPLAQIVGVTARPDITELMYMPVGAQFLGVHDPGKVLAGRLTLADGTGVVFCDVRDAQHALAIDLHHHEYKRLLIEVSGQTPEQARASIEAAVGHVLPAAR